MTWVNNLNKTAIENTKAKMRADPHLGARVPVTVKATWEKGVVTGVNGKLQCYAPPEIQIGTSTKGPSTNSYCPLIAGGCFCLVMMLDAGEKGYQFEALRSEIKADADMIGFYKSGWEGTENNKGITVTHAWPNDIHLGIVVRSEQPQEELSKLADYSEQHCPSSEMLKRDFPVDVDRFAQNMVSSQNTDWDNIPVYYDMERYHEISKEEKFQVQQEANLTWHCHNENPKHENALMSFEFPQDSKSSLVLGFDSPIGRESNYANPVQACFFGGLSSFLHTVACRIYAKGYKVAKIDGTIETKINKRNVLGVNAFEFDWIFPEGASIKIDVISNAPKEILQEVQEEAEAMSPTMMNWREALPFHYGVAREEPTGEVPVQRMPSKVSEEKPSGPKTLPSLLPKKGSKDMLLSMLPKRGSKDMLPHQRSQLHTPKENMLNFFWKTSRPVGAQ